MQQKVTLKVNGKPVDLDITNDQAKAISDAYIASTKSIMERIDQSDDPWAYVLADQNITREEFARITQFDDEDDISNKSIKILAQCLNEGPLDPSKNWYTPVFNRDKGAGFGLTFTHYDDWFRLRLSGSAAVLKPLNWLSSPEENSLRYSNHLCLT